jgi:hypothetical protein
MLLLLFVETEAVTGVFNFVEAPKQKMNYSEDGMDNRKFIKCSQVF